MRKATPQTRGFRHPVVAVFDTVRMWATAIMVASSPFVATNGLRLGCFTQASSR